MNFSNTILICTNVVFIHTVVCKVDNQRSESYTTLYGSTFVGAAYNMLSYMSLLNIQSSADFTDLYRSAVE